MQGPLIRYIDKSLKNKNAKKDRKTNIILERPQNCVFSGVLFNILISKLDEHTEKNLICSLNLWVTGSLKG